MAWLFSGKKTPTEHSEGAAEKPPSGMPYSLAEAPEIFDRDAMDPSRLHPLAGLGKNLDYFSLEDAKLANLPGGKTAFPSRGWSDDLTYGTGTVYLSGFSAGSWPISLIICSAWYRRYLGGF